MRHPDGIYCHGCGWIAREAAEPSINDRTEGQCACDLCPICLLPECDHSPELCEGCDGEPGDFARGCAECDDTGLVEHGRRPRNDYERDVFADRLDEARERYLSEEANACRVRRQDQRAA